MESGRRTKLGKEQETQIGVLVDRFYSRVRKDRLLGSMFEQHVDDWDAHLSTMKRFWSSAIYRTGLYSGNPLVAHQGLPGLSPAHFERWLALWTTSVREVICDGEQQPYLQLASRMARSMSARLDAARTVIR